MARGRNKRLLQWVVIFVLVAFLISTVAVSLVGLNFGPTEEVVDENYENYGLEVVTTTGTTDSGSTNVDMEADMQSGVILTGETE